DALTWMFGESRGCYSLECFTVKTENNPVNNQAYTGVKSIMNYPYNETTWDPYSIRAVDFYAHRVYMPPNVIHGAVADTVQIAVSGVWGEPVAYCSLAVYGVRYRTYVVDTPAVFYGTTDKNGLFTFTGNPYNPDNKASLTYFNFLVKAWKEDQTAYGWMPIHEIAQAWLDNEGKTYKQLIHF
ncbi:MAG: hypothetical protein JW768_11070, partial [Chitinispirillaceae bacterium]|nr:hypothetical protein [Chitinispirillaceae bacterium]